MGGLCPPFFYGRNRIKFIKSYVGGNVWVLKMF